MDTSRLFYGDNLDVLRESVATGSVDLVYLDPPFNSDRNYNVIFHRSPPGTVHDNAAQIQAFGDTWTWTPSTSEQFAGLLCGEVPVKVADSLSAMRALLDEGDALAYLVNMTPRLVELHRVLKSTGSLYLHCDPTMSHYLKIILDAIFGPENFRAEIIWRRYGSHNDANGYGAVHDVILYYVKSRAFQFNKQFTDYDPAYVAQRFRYSDSDGRRYREQNLASPNPRPNLTYPYEASNGQVYHPPANGWKVTPEKMAELDRAGRLHFPTKADARLAVKNYLDEGRGIPVPDIWTDIAALGGTNPERLGYPTQKPVSLLERILSASSSEGDVVLDPFCGCGTTIDAAQRLNRRWIGIDITYIAVDLIRKRLEHTFGPQVNDTYIVSGIPRDLGAAKNLFQRSPFDFERWAVSLVNGTPNQKQVGDRGIDGVVRFYTDSKGQTGRVLVSVKGGKSLGPQFVRDLVGTVHTERAEMGSLLTLSEPTRGIRDAVAHAGTYQWPVTGAAYPRAQVLTVAELLSGKRLQAPPAMLMPYIPAGRHTVDFDQMTLL